MKKNIVFIPFIKSGHRPPDYIEYSFKTWKYWVSKHKNVDLFIFENPVENLDYMKVTWQRWYALDILRRNNINYDQVLVVDADTMIKWDCPDFFELTNYKFSVVRDNGKLSILIKNIRYFKEDFSGVNFDLWSYFNAGFVILNDIHKNFLKNFINYYHKNNKQLLSREEADNLNVKLVPKTTDQTLLNYYTRKENVSLKFLDNKYNVTRLSKNGLLDDDLIKEKFFIDAGYVWHFNCMPGDQRKLYMKKIWSQIKDYYR